MASAYKHLSKVSRGAETSLRMPRPNVLSEVKGLIASQTKSSLKLPWPNVISAGKGHVASQNESGSPTMMELFITWTQILEEMNRRLDKWDNNLDRMDDKVKDKAKKSKSINRPAGLQQLQAQQPRLVVKAGAFLDKRDRENKEAFAPHGRSGDISSNRVHDDPMGWTSFGNTTVLSALTIICSDDALVNEGPEASKPCLSSVEIRKAVPAGDLLHAGSASIYKAQRDNFPHDFFPGAPERRPRRTILVRQQARHLPSTTVPGT